MSFKTRFLTPALGLAALLAVAPSLSAQSDKDFQITLPENIVWKDAGHGVKIAVVYGDPSKPGQYVIRAYFPPGVMSSPHFHGEDRHVIVVEERGMRARTIAGIRRPPCRSKPAATCSIRPVAFITMDQRVLRAPSFRSSAWGPARRLSCIRRKAILASQGS